jgi:hypothetical protein
MKEADGENLEDMVLCLLATCNSDKLAIFSSWW